MNARISTLKGNEGGGVGRVYHGDIGTDDISAIGSEHHGVPVRVDT